MRPTNPITVWPIPKQMVSRDGSWNVEVVADIGDLTSDVLDRFVKAAGYAPGCYITGDLCNLVFVFNTETAAEGAIRRLQDTVDVIMRGD